MFGGAGGDGPAGGGAPCGCALVGSGARGGGWRSRLWGSEGWGTEGCVSGCLLLCVSGCLLLCVLVCVRCVLVCVRCVLVSWCLCVCLGWEGVGAVGMKVVLDESGHGMKSATFIPNLDETVPNLRAKVYVYSASVLCLGKVSENPQSNIVWEDKLTWFKSSSEYRALDTSDGEPMEFEWNVFPGFISLQLVQEVQQFMNKMGEPEQFQGRVVFNVDVQ